MILHIALLAVTVCAHWHKKALDGAKNVGGKVIDTGKDVGNKVVDKGKEAVDKVCSDDLCSAVCPCKDGYYCDVTSCTVKKKYGQSCIQLYGHRQQCEETCQVFVDWTKNYCTTHDGALLGSTCMKDSQCLVDSWCKGGGAFSYGQCSACPHWCREGEGCHACNNDMAKLTCGKASYVQQGECAFSVVKGWAEKVGDFIMCMGGERSICDIDLSNQGYTCMGNPSIDENCRFKVGCADHYETEKLFEKEFYHAPSTFSIKGGIRGRVTPDIIFNPVKGYVKADISFMGEVRGYIKAAMEGEGRAEINKPLGPSRTIFAKFFVAFYVPIMVRIKYQPFFWGTLEAQSSGWAAFGMKWGFESSASFDIDLYKLTADAKKPSTKSDSARMTLLADGDVAINLNGYLGLRLTVEVNKMAVSLDVAAALRSRTDLHAKIGHGLDLENQWKELLEAEPKLVGQGNKPLDVCIKGFVEVKTGVVDRTRVGFSIPNPKDAAIQACNFGVGQFQIVGTAADKLQECGWRQLADFKEGTDRLCQTMAERFPRSIMDVDLSGVSPSRVVKDWSFHAFSEDSWELNLLESGKGCGAGEKKAVANANRELLVSNTGCLLYQDKKVGDMIVPDTGKDHDFYIRCAHSPLAGFKLDKCRSRQEQVSWRYTCGGGPEMYAENIVKKETECSDMGGMPIIFLDRHEVRCPDQSVLTGWHVTDHACDPGKGKIAYTCAKTEYEGGVAEKETNCAAEAEAPLQYLDRHDVACPGGSALTRFRFERCDTSNIKVRYWCVSTKKLPMFEPGTAQDKLYGLGGALDRASLLAADVCFGSNADSFGEFTIPTNMVNAGATLDFDDLVMVHKRGSVNCVPNGSKGCDREGSNWGCECQEAIQVFITDTDNNIILPDDYTGGTSYFMDGFTGMSNVLVHMGEYELSVGKTYRVWHGESLMRNWHEDNPSDRSCFDLYATGVKNLKPAKKQPRDCLHQECGVKGGKCDWCSSGESQGYCCRGDRRSEGCPENIGTSDYYSCLAKVDDSWMFSRLDDGSIMHVKGDVNIVWIQYTNCIEYKDKKIGDMIVPDNEKDDKSHIRCGVSPLSGFQLKKCRSLEGLPKAFQNKFKAMENNDVMLWRYTCGGGAEMYAKDITKKETQCNEMEGKPIIYFDRHEVRCPENEQRILSGWHVTDDGCNAGMGKIAYTCAKTEYDANGVIEKETACTDYADAPLHFLDRHDVSCHDGKALTGFRFERCDTSNIKIRFWCVGTKVLSMATLAPSKAPTSTPAPSKAPTSTPAPSDAPTSTPAPSKMPTSTPAPSKMPTSTPAPSDAPTSTPAPSFAPTSTPAPSFAPTSTPAPSYAPTSTPAPTKEIDTIAGAKKRCEASNGDRKTCPSALPPTHGVCKAKGKKKGFKCSLEAFWYGVCDRLEPKICEKALEAKACKRVEWVQKKDCKESEQARKRKCKNGKKKKFRKAKCANLDATHIQIGKKMFPIGVSG